MSYTQSDLAAVRAAIARGERSVQYSDRSVTYRSMSELFQAEERIAQALAEASSETRKRQSFGVASKGF